MQLTILCAGKLKEAFLREAVAEYSKRISRYARIRIAEVSDAPDSLSEEAAKELEAKAMSAQIPPRSFVIATAVDGREMKSEEFASLLARGLEAGDSKLCLLIGGSRGLADSLLRQADVRLSLSRMTFPHQLFRVILLEQIYRGFKILAGEPYHK